VAERPASAELPLLVLVLVAALVVESVVEPAVPVPLERSSTDDERVDPEADALGHTLLYTN
jgi:hypothetical protein